MSRKPRFKVQRLNDGVFDQGLGNKRWLPVYDNCPDQIYRIVEKR